MYGAARAAGREEWPRGARRAAAQRGRDERERRERNGEGCRRNRAEDGERSKVSAGSAERRRRGGRRKRAKDERKGRGPRYTRCVPLFRGFIAAVGINEGPCFHGGRVAVQISFYYLPRGIYSATGRRAQGAARARESDAARTASDARRTSRRDVPTSYSGIVLTLARPSHFYRYAGSPRFPKSRFARLEPFRCGMLRKELLSRGRR